MATATELKKQIKALEANLKNKSKYKPNVVEKLEEKLKTAKAELSKLTKSTTKKPSVLQKLKKMVNSKADLKIYKKPIDKSGRKTDLKKDGDVSALPMGKRITQNVGGNRVAGKSGKAKKGNVYYEYRANRVDVRQPSVKVKRPNKLEEGGMMADGGMMAQGGRLNVVKKYNTISDYLKDAKRGDLVLIGRDVNDLEWIGDSHLNRFVKIDEEGEGIFQIFGRKGLVSFPSNKNVIVVDRKYEDGGIMAKGGQVSGYFTFRPYVLENGFYKSTTLSSVSPDNVMRKGLEGKLKGNDFNSAEYIADAIMQEFQNVAKLDIVKRGATLLKSKVVATLERSDFDKNEYSIKYMADGGELDYLNDALEKGLISESEYLSLQNSKEPNSIYRPLSGKISAKATISYDVPKEEFDQFVNYVYDVYEEEGYNKSQVRVAVRKYLKDLEGEFTWGGGDSLDRERVYEYLKNPKQKGIVNPFFADGGMMARGGEVSEIATKLNSIKMYYLKTSGGAEYLCSEKVNGRGTLNSKYVVRIDHPDEDTEMIINKVKRIRMYYHKTSGGAEYLCSEKVDGSKFKGSLNSKYVVRIDHPDEDTAMIIRGGKYADGGMMARGGQGYDDREDERLAMEYGKMANKDFIGSHEAREHSRRDDARFEERNIMEMGGKVQYKSHRLNK